MDVAPTRGSADVAGGTDKDKDEDEDEESEAGCIVGQPRAEEKRPKRSRGEEASCAGLLPPLLITLLMLSSLRCGRPGSSPRRLHVSVVHRLRPSSSSGSETLLQQAELQPSPSSSSSSSPEESPLQQRQHVREDGCCPH